MNAFLQSMLGKSTEEISYNSTNDIAPGDNDMKMEYARSSWIKKLGNNSPKKYQTVSSPKLRITSIESQFHNIPNIPTKVPVMFHPPTRLPDLETIICEFEKNFLSPTKSEASNNSTLKEGNFVKKIVAAIEDKYKAYNDSKIEEDVKTVLDNRKLSRNNLRERNKHRFSLSLEPSKKKSHIFGSTPKIDHENTVKEESTKNPVSFNSPKEKGNGQRNTWISIFSSPFKYGGSKETKHSHISPKRFKIKSDHSRTKTTTEERMNKEEKADDDENDDDDDDHGDDDDDDDEDKDYQGISSWDISEVGALNDSRFLRVSSPFKTSDDETKSIQSVDLSLTYDFEESTLLDIDVRTIEENTVIAYDDEKETSKEDRREEKIRAHSSESSSSSSKGSRRVPKIIGAFLKKPIKVERTAVDWIPITGKKLPRKRSLKKLLSMLTRNKSSDKKQEKIFSSERNINEEPRELQDSGYDEKSSTSTSSLRSLASISEVLLRQERTDNLEMRRRNDFKLRTFQTRNSLNRFNNTNLNDNKDYERDESIDEEILPFKIIPKKNEKLRLTEVSREVVTKDLGPYYPSQTAIMTMSLDRRSHSKSSSSCHVVRSKFPRQPRLSRIPKHPYVSITKIDQISQVKSPPAIVSSFTVTNDDREKSFRMFREKQSIKECTYDVPRRYLSKSESKLNEIGPEESETKMNEEPIYDLPKPCSFSRPTSSIYEDALSLKRRLDYLPMTAIPNFYSASEEGEPHYATIRRGIKRVHCTFNQQSTTTTMGTVSCTDLRAHESTTSL